MKNIFFLLALSLFSCSLFAQSVKTNQVAFKTTGMKRAVVPANGDSTFVITDQNGNQIFEGKLSQPKTWFYSKESVQLADFTSFDEKGRFKINVPNTGTSYSFDIKENAYLDVTKASIKAFYFNRSSTEITKGGIYNRETGHPDTIVYIHPSAASPNRPAESTISSPKGWYDAGDYGKYIVNSGISTYTILAAYEHYSQMLDSLTWDIPESSNDLPDVLDEVIWNLDWMLSMQDPYDGGVYHKLTTKNFSGHISPKEGTEKRYVVMKNTAATLDFAAVMAQASRIFKQYENQKPGYSKTCLDAAIKAWNWARANPQTYYLQPQDVTTGEYGDKSVSDEFMWAAIELYVTTKQDSFYVASNIEKSSPNLPNWQNVGTLAYISILNHKESVSDLADINLIQDKYLKYCDRLVEAFDKSAYGIVMGEQAGNFNWGSNSAALNQSFLLFQAYNLTEQKQYLNAAQSNLDYVLGQNPLSISYVTGLGTNSTLHPHHRPSMGDNNALPVPGFVAGGPNPAQQDNCPGYLSKLPALSYLDDECSYASNEIAINWNAPLFYTAAALQSITGIEEEELWVDQSTTSAITWQADQNPFSITANVSGPVSSYQWMISTNGGKSFKTIKDGKSYTGTNTATLSIIELKKKKDILVKCLVKSKGKQEIFSLPQAIVMGK